MAVSVIHPSRATRYRLPPFGFWTGFATGVSAAASLWVESLVRIYPHASATEALRSDWNAIGKDIKGALEGFDEQHRTGRT